eukprot:m.98059 g.98059  ORF g.98059 m.98059 type:complete len:51 (+) comp51380_c0_seq18:849-1001(+)
MYSPQARLNALQTKLDTTKAQLSEKDKELQVLFGEAFLAPKFTSQLLARV